MKLPLKLSRDPLIEAVFEMRFQSKLPASNILPGLVFSQFGGKKSIEKLPIADLPEPFRQSDQNLRYAPVLRIHWENFLLLFGDRSVGVACKVPYPGWATGFKPIILKMVELVGGATVIDAMERCSLKYVNIITRDYGTPTEIAKFALRIGSHDAAADIFQIRTERRKDGLTSIVQLSAEGTAITPTNVKVTGMVLDIDIIVIKDESFADFARDLPERLEKIHQGAKSIFFDCLAPETLQKLGPSYE